ncbi:hypothetical protein KFE25_010926 [Diacronema lutheri]|uniref:Uncharacterized protein n=1 Tax=Diacronema lutheri TaxID=2081491 RepID=A0A8J6C2K0_DIALT|nr:hypothetical protein KFE25_010926 [Diacronema lutheri]
MEHLRGAAQLANALVDEVGVASADAFRGALVRACASTWAAVLSWGHLFWLCALPAWRVAALVASAAWPHARDGGAAAWRAFAAQERAWIAAELAAAALTVLGWLLERHIRRQRYVSRARAAWRRLSARADAAYTTLLASIRAKSRTLAALFPHLAFAAAAAALAALAPSTTRALSEARALLSVGFPLAATLAALRSAEPAAEDHWLRYWVLYALLELAKGAALALPLARRAAAGAAWAAAWVPLLELFALLWLHLPRAGGTELAFARARTLVCAAAPLDPRARGEWGEWAGARALLAHGGALIGATVGGGVFAAARDSGAMLLALLFLPMPGALTHGGCLLFGLGYPAFTSVGALAALEAAAERAARRAREPAAATPSAVVRVGEALWRSADKLRRRTSGAVRADEPAAASASAAAAAAAAATPARALQGEEAVAAAGVDGAAARRLVRARLQYWLVRMVLALALAPFRPLLEWLPLVEHGELCAVVLLQLPYVDGAARLYGLIVEALRSADGGVSPGAQPFTPSLHAQPARRLQLHGAGDTPTEAGPAVPAPMVARAAVE